MGDKDALGSDCPVCGDPDNDGGFCVNPRCARAGEQAASVLHKTATPRLVEQDANSRRWYILGHTGERLHGPYLDRPL